MVDLKSFFTFAKVHFEKIKNTQKNNIKNVAAMMGDCMTENGIVQLVGINHGRAFCMELGYRAGGLMPFHQFNIKDLVMREIVSEAELKKEHFEDSLDIAHKFFELYKIEKEDMFIISSISGCEGLIVEIADLAKKKGHKVVAVVSLENCKNGISRHPSGKKLVEIADMIIDTCANFPDTVITLQDKWQLGQISTISGNVIAQMLTAETYAYLKAKGFECPILLSANVKGADIHNKALSDKYQGRWNS